MRGSNDTYLKIRRKISAPERSSLGSNLIMESLLFSDIKRK